MLLGAIVPPVAATACGPSLPPAHAAGGEEWSDDVAAAPAARGRAAVTADLAGPAPNRPAPGPRPPAAGRRALSPFSRAAAARRPTTSRC